MSAGDESWFIHSQGNQGDRKGPYSTVEMEDLARRRLFDSTTLISSKKYTKGRVVEAKRIGRFFNILTEVQESTGLTVVSAPNSFSELAVILEECEKEESSGISRFMADGQDPSVICKLANRVEGICTKDEQVLYMAVQQKPVVNLAPDAVVLTSRRVILFRQRILGRLDFVDVPWLYVANVHMREDLMGATVSVSGLNGHVEVVSHLPKAQARKIYRIAQNMEERMVELRRLREMEERRACASQITVNNDLGGFVQAIQPYQANSDPVQSLQSLKRLLDSGLIEQAEYDAKKREILDRM